MSESVEFKGYCPMCQQTVAGQKRPIHHKQQLKLCLFTIGFWLPIWLAMSMSPRDVVCVRCSCALENVKPKKR